MQLTGNLKKKVEGAASREEARGHIEAAGMLLTDEELDTVAAGSSGGSDIHDLSRFITRTVRNVIHYDDTACLTLRRTPGGEIIPGVGWQNGDPILVHGQYREDGWYFAYDSRTGKYGYVNPNNVM